MLYAGAVLGSISLPCAWSFASHDALLLFPVLYLISWFMPLFGCGAHPPVHLREMIPRRLRLEGLAGLKCIFCILPDW